MSCVRSSSRRTSNSATRGKGRAARSCRSTSNPYRDETARPATSFRTTDASDKRSSQNENGMQNVGCCPSRPRNSKDRPPNGSRRNFSWIAKPSKPLRITVAPPPSQIRVPGGSVVPLSVEFRDHRSFSFRPQHRRRSRQEWVRSKFADRSPRLSCAFGPLTPKPPSIDDNYGFRSRPYPATSCNLAEYAGLIAVLRYLLDAGLSDERIVMIGDSQLVINQMFGRRRIKRGWGIFSRRPAPGFRRRSHSINCADNFQS